MRLHRLVVCLVVAAACGGGTQKSTTTAATPPPAADPIPTSAGPACNAVAGQVAIVVHADTAPDQKESAAAATTERARTRCETDRWSDDARNCFGSAQSQVELDGCTQLLSEPQRKGFAALELPRAEAAQAAPPPPKKKAMTRGAVPKDKSKGGESDPCDGGE